MPRIYKTLSLYIGKHFLVALLVTLLVLMGLVLLIDFIELMRRAARREEVSALMVLGMAALKMPQMMQQVLPFAVLVGAMAAIWRLSRSHELVVLRSVGVSFWQFLAPAMVMVLLIGAVNITLINPLASQFYKKYEHLEDSLILQTGGSFSLSGGGLWLRESLEAGGSMVVHARTVRQDGLTLTLRALTFILTTADEQFDYRVDAAEGVLLDGSFLLTDAWIMEIGRPGRRVDSLDLPTSLTLGRVQENFASPETLSFWELPDFIAFFEAAGFSTQRHRIHLHSLIASPVLLCAMVLVAAVFSAAASQRKGGMLMRVAGGVCVGFLLFFFTRLTLALGLSSALPLWLAAWSPTLVTLLIGSAVLLHLEDG